MDVVFLTSAAVTAVVLLAVCVVVTRRKMPIAQGSRSRRSATFLRRYRNAFATAAGCFVIVGVVGAAVSSTALVAIAIYGAMVGISVAVFAREELLRKAASGTASAPPGSGAPPAKTYVAGAIAVVLAIATAVTMAAGLGVLAVPLGLSSAALAFYAWHRTRRAANAH